MAESTKTCPQCGKENPASRAMCSCSWMFKFQPPAGNARGRSQPAVQGRKSKRPSLIFASLWFCFLGLNWTALILLGLNYMRPHPLADGDKVIGALGILIALFYFWVAIGVYLRKNYIWSPAMVCASLSILSIPIGPIISIPLLSRLSAVKDEFMRPPRTF